MFKEQVILLLNNKIVLQVSEIIKILNVQPLYYSFLNREIKELENDDFIKSVGDNIYTIVYKSRWGDVIPSEEEIVYYFYVLNNQGYISGATYLNYIGISSLVPHLKQIVSNKYNIPIYNLKHTELTKPKVYINSSNVKYLQLLDGIYDFYNNHCDAKYPLDVFKDLIIKFKLDKDALYETASCIYPQIVYDTLLKIL